MWAKNLCDRHRLSVGVVVACSDGDRIVFQLYEKMGQRHRWCSGVLFGDVSVSKRVFP